MVAPIVNTHVCARHHVAVDTLNVVSFVLVMVSTREFLRQVAGAADITGRTAGSESRRMRIMAIAAADPGLVHIALQERAVYIHLLQDLAIGCRAMLCRIRNRLLPVSGLRRSARTRPLALAAA